jgi:serine acetyltransferase
MMRRLKAILLSKKENRLYLWFYILLNTVYHHPIIGVVHFIVNFAYSLFLTNKLCGVSLFPKMYFSKEIFSVKIIKSRKSLIVSDVGNLFVFESWLSGTARTTILLGHASKLIVTRSFYIGDGCKIQLLDGGALTLGGESNQQISGITCNSIITCAREVTLGKGVIMSWACYITDTTQHSINGEVKIQSVYIGDHVWISEGVTCAPGTYVEAGSIIGSKSYVNNIFRQRNSFIAGAPAKLVRSDVFWGR